MYKYIYNYNYINVNKQTYITFPFLTFLSPGISDINYQIINNII